MGSWALETIERSLCSDDAEERRQATAELARTPLEEALPLLYRSLGDEDWRVRKEATVAARAFGPAEPLVSALVGAFGEGDNVGLRNAAVEVLAGMGSAATPALARALPALDADGRKLVVETLGRARDPAALPALEAAAGDPDDNVRQGAIEAIAAVGPLAQARVEQILLARLDDRDAIVRLVALRGLVSLEVAIPWPRLPPFLADPTLRAAALSAAALSDSPEAAETLARELGRARGRAFRQALLGLGRLAEGPLAGAVAEALRAGGPEVARRVLATAADAGGADAPERATALSLAAAAGLPGAVDAALLALGEELLAEPAQRALGALGEGALPAMVARLASRDLPAEERAPLVGVIAAVLPGPDGSGAPASTRFQEALGALRGAARDPDRRVAGEALHALARLGGPGDLELAAERTLSEARPAALAAEGALAALAGRFPAAARALADRFGGAEATLLPAAITLGAIGAAGGFEDRDATFLAHAATAGDTRARRAAVEAVSELRAAVGAAFPAAMEVLRVALTDEEHEVQLAAARALGRLSTAKDAPPAREVVELVERSGAVDLVAATVRAIGDGITLANGRPADGGDLLSALATFAGSAPVPVALAAVDALGQALRAGAPDAAVALSAALDHPDEPVVKAALIKLSAADAAGAVRGHQPGLRSDEPSSAPVPAALARALDHASTAVRVLAVELLADRASDDARAWLVRQLAAEPDRRVREAIQRALAPPSAPAPAPSGPRTEPRPDGPPSARSTPRAAEEGR